VKIQGNLLKADQQKQTENQIPEEKGDSLTSGTGQNPRAVKVKIKNYQ